MSESIESIARWGVDTLGPATPQGAAIKIVEESAEVAHASGISWEDISVTFFQAFHKSLDDESRGIAPDMHKEFADVAITALTGPERFGISTRENLDSRMKAIRKRSWTIDPETGVARHIKQ